MLENTLMFPTAHFITGSFPSLLMKKVPAFIDIAGCDIVS